MMTDGEPLAPIRFRLLSDVELEAQPEPEWTVRGVLPHGCLALLYGPPGAGKSFVLLDLALAIATQPTWHGHSLVSGPVVYVAAGEGCAGLSKRVRAWKAVHDLTQIPDALFMTSALQLHVPDEVTAFCTALAGSFDGRRPALIVLDTLARCMVGCDENSFRDLSAAIAGADYIRAMTGACVLLAHHPQKQGDRERGHSALHGAVDTNWWLRDDDGTRVLECKKQKDAAEFEEMRFVLQPYEGSCVVARSHGLSLSLTKSLTANQRKCLVTLRDVDTGTGVLSGVWLEASSVPKASFHRTIKQLVDAGYVNGAKRGRYHLTPEGVARLVSVSPSLKAVS